MPDGGPQSEDDGVVVASELFTRRRPTPDRSRMPDGGPQSADDGVVEASEYLDSKIKAKTKAKVTNKLIRNEK